MINMTIARKLMLSCLVVMAAAPAFAQDAAAGKASFQHTCEPCHGKGVGDDGRALLPGTDALRIKYQGSLPAALEDRSDLTADAIKTYVRQGSWSMPPFRKTELTDAEIVDIAAYLVESSRQP